MALWNGSERAWDPQQRRWRDPPALGSFVRDDAPTERLTGGGRARLVSVTAAPLGDTLIIPLSDSVCRWLFAAQFRTATRATDVQRSHGK